jgi:hypothetical protein
MLPLSRPRRDPAATGVEHKPRIDANLAENGVDPLPHLLDFCVNLW